MITAEHLIKEYSGFRAVDDVSFQVEKGEVLGFLGPNGAGKSTSMKMITGFLKPTSGTASIGGFNIQSHPAAAKKTVGYLPESGPLYSEMTVLEFLKFTAEIRQIHAKEQTQAMGHVLEICHLHPVQHQTIETLSKGFRQRVGLAQALIHNPENLILDEPTDGLDPNQKQEVRQLIASMAAEKSIILSTHILEEVQAMCTRIIIIAQGKTLVDETPAQLRKRHPDYRLVHLKTRSSSLDEVRNTLANISDIQSIENLADETLAIRPVAGKDVKTALWQCSREKSWNIDHLDYAPTSLERVFRDLTLSA